MLLLLGGTATIITGTGALTIPKVTVRGYESVEGRGAAVAKRRAILWRIVH